MFPEKVPKRLHSLLLTRMVNEFPALMESGRSPATTPSIPDGRLTGT